MRIVSKDQELGIVIAIVGVYQRFQKLIDPKPRTAERAWLHGPSFIKISATCTLTGKEVTFELVFSFRQVETI